MNAIKQLLVFLAVVLSATSCKKEFDTPPKREIPVGSILTIDSLRKMYAGATISFTSDYSVFAVVTADEKNGNLYKNVFAQDKTGAINLRLINSGGLYQGDSIRIYLKGTVLSKYNGMLQIDSVDVDKNIIKQKTLVDVAPQIVTIEQINSSLQSKLIKLENVEFKSTEIGQTYADAVNQLSKNRTIVNCNNVEIIARTSGYANFANEKIPEGSGSLVALVGEFNGTFQLYIRSFGEVVMTGPRCTGYPPLLLKDFEDNSITSGGWTIQNVSGTINWTTNSTGSLYGSYYGQCSNYISPTNFACETWLISPSVNLSTSSGPYLTFYNGYKYSGPALGLFVSTDYSSGLPSTANWTPISFTASSGNFVWVNSDTILLSSYKTSNVHIAFKYSGTSSNGSTWEIDDIMIKEN